jgi:exosortase A-associated hydrolase 2
MVAGDHTAPQPVVIDSPSGRLFGVYHAGARHSGPRCAVLYVPPFAEEMNRSRRMAALQARALAASGVDTLLLDLFGTGDSAGNFRDARLPLWLGDIAAAAEWLEAQGSIKGRTSLCLWGLRLGALLACVAAAGQPQRFKRLLLWQPVTDGKVMLTQFLRIRVAAAMAEGGAPEKTEELRAQLAAGASVEVAGYEVASELAQALDRLRMDGLDLGAAAPVTWLEVAAEASDRLLPASARVVEAWRKTATEVSTATVAGDPFWTLQETTLAPALLTATTGALQPCPA